MLYKEKDHRNNHKLWLPHPWSCNAMWFNQQIIYLVASQVLESVKRILRQVQVSSKSVYNSHKTTASFYTDLKVGKGTCLHLNTMSSQYQSLDLREGVKKNSEKNFDLLPNQQTPPLSLTGQIWNRMRDPNAGPVLKKSRSYNLGWDQE